MRWAESTRATRPEQRKVRSERNRARRRKYEPVNILHSNTDPDLLTRLREMLDSSARADIAVGYFFMSGFGPVSAELSKLDKVRILVGRADREVIETVAAGLQQPDALKARLEADGLVQRRDRPAIAQDSVDRIASGVALLPQTGESQEAVAALREMVASGQAEVRAYRRSPLHAKAYLCWYGDHAEPGSGGRGLLEPHARRLQR